MLCGDGMKLIKNIKHDLNLKVYVPIWHLLLIELQYSIFVCLCFFLLGIIAGILLK